MVVVHLLSRSSNFDNCKLSLEMFMIGALLAAAGTAAAYSPEALADEV